MKKTSLYICLTGIVFLFYGLCFSDIASSDVNVNIGINTPLPRVVLSSPPVVILIPGTYVYYVPDIEADIIFYHGYWWRPYDGRWYRASSYNGPWVYIVTKSVPYVLINLPPSYRHVPPGHQRIPYGQLKKHWSRWEREKHWDNREFKHEEKERHKEEKWEHKQGKGKGKGRHDD